MAEYFPLAKKARSSTLVTCLVACVFTTVARADDWIRGQTDHFVVYSDVGRSATREYLERLEGFKYLTELLLGANPANAAGAGRFSVYLLKDQDNLKIVRPDVARYTAGMYLHCVEGAQAYAYGAKSGLGMQDFGLLVLQHEYAHHVMFSRMRRFYPAWYVEGFAEYLGTVTARGNSYLVGAGNEGRLTQLASDRPWIRFETLLDTKQLTAEAAAKRVDAFQFYAQSWLLTHYMLEDSERVRGFNRYFESVGNGEDALSSFQNETGIAPSQLERILRARMRKMPGLRVTVPQLPDSTISMNELPKGQADYLLQASVLRTCPDPSYGKKLVEGLRLQRAAHTDDFRFKTELARGELLFGDREAARRELEALARSDDANFDVFYLLGRSYFEAALQTPDQRASFMTKANREFLTAYQLDKLNAPNMYFLSKSLDDGGTPGKAMLNASMGASVLLPSVHAYAVNAAMIQLRAGNPIAAVHVMQPFASNPHDAASSARVSAMINAIEAGKELSEIVATLTGESPQE